MTAEERATWKNICMQKGVITAKDILKFDNVPPQVAGKYLGKSVNFIYYGLQDKVLPFGHAVIGRKKGRWSYHISPAKLVAYQESEELTEPPLREMEAAS